MMRATNLLGCTSFFLCTLLKTIPGSCQLDVADYHSVNNPISSVEAPLLTGELIDFEAMRQDFVLETKQIQIPGHPHAFNASIIRWRGSLLMAFRSYDPVTHATNPIGLTWLDEEFNPIGEPQFFAFPFKNPVLPPKQQDPRLVSVEGRLFLAYNNIREDIIQKEMRRMFFVELTLDGDRFSASDPECILHFDQENPSRYEKNWAPFEYEGKLLLTYSLIPHRILEPVRGTNSCNTFCSTEQKFPWKWGTPRGGTQAIRDKDHYIAFFHSWTDLPSVQSAGKKIAHYFMGAYTFDAHPPFRLTAVSPQPIVADSFYRPPFHKTWKPMRCIFPAGIVLDENYIWVSYGRQDHEIWIAKIDKHKLMRSLKPLAG